MKDTPSIHYRVVINDSHQGHVEYLVDHECQATYIRDINKLSDVKIVEVRDHREHK